MWGGWLHLEARYNDEDLRTGSLWVGYNFAPLSYISIAFSLASQCDFLKRLPSN